jgi:hypothetical protein
VYSHRAALMRALFVVTAIAACCAASSLASAWWLDPVQRLNETQSVVLQEYLAAFCLKDDRHDKQFIVGTAAVLSRIIVRSNLGNLALAEYAKCKLTQN